MFNTSGKSGSILDLPLSQKERLAYIEMRLFFLGLLRRADIEARFGVASAAATRDIAIYRELAPDNLQYDSTQRFYTPTTSFNPFFEFSNERVLTWLLHGFGDGLQGLKRAIPCEGPNNLVNPDLNNLAFITRAIHLKLAINICYLSLTSGESNREVVPLALVDNGQRWHVRCFERKSASFRDFVLTRIVQISPMGSPVAEHELLNADEQWQRIVDIQLVPHPGIAWPAAVIADYGMHDGCLWIKARAAIAGYTLRRWLVDCSEGASLSPKEHHLWLKNTQTLYGVESSILAPGYREPRMDAVNTDY